MSKIMFYTFLYFKIGKTLRFDIQEVEKWLAEFKRDTLN